MKARLEKRPSGEVRLMVKVEDLHEDPANARQHDDRSVESIRLSYERFGQQQPVVIDKNGKVVAGNGAIRMAKAVGLKEVWATVSGLKGIDQAAFAIADNRSSELAGWDFKVLTDLFTQLRSEGIDLQVVGWTPEEVEPIMSGKPPSETLSGRTVKFTSDQMDIVRRVVKRYRSKEKSLSFGGAVERICSAHLAGVVEEEDTDG